MKKYVQEATDINIWTSIKNNTFGRNKDIKEFIDGLELIDESASLAWMRNGEMERHFLSDRLKKC